MRNSFDNLVQQNNSSVATFVAAKWVNFDLFRKQRGKEIERDMDSEQKISTAQQRGISFLSIMIQYKFGVILCEQLFTNKKTTK